MVKVYVVFVEGDYDQGIENVFTNEDDAELFAELYRNTNNKHTYVVDFDLREKLDVEIKDVIKVKVIKSYISGNYDESIEFKRCAIGDEFEEINYSEYFIYEYHNKGKWYGAKTTSDHSINIELSRELLSPYDEDSVKEEMKLSVKAILDVIEGDFDNYKDKSSEEINEMLNNIE